MASLEENERQSVVDSDNAGEEEADSPLSRSFLEELDGGKESDTDGRDAFGETDPFDTEYHLPNDKELFGNKLLNKEERYLKPLPVCNSARRSNCTNAEIAEKFGNKDVMQSLMY